MKPKCVGFWIIEVVGNEISKYGKDGGCEFPYPPRTPQKKLLAEVAYLRQNAMPKTRYCIVKVFDNGQMVHYYATDQDG